MLFLISDERNFRLEISAKPSLVMYCHIPMLSHVIDSTSYKISSGPQRDLLN